VEGDVALAVAGFPVGPGLTGPAGWVGVPDLASLVGAEGPVGGGSLRVGETGEMVLPGSGDAAARALGCVDGEGGSAVPGAICPLGIVRT
jgi:hypothetical protein